MENSSCQLCGETFNSQEELIEHLLEKHLNNEKQQSCGEIPSQLNAKKGYSCQVCGKSLASKRNLNRHIKEKHSAKPFSCSKCSKDFPRSSTLKKHEESCLKRKSSEDGEVFSCFCGASFPSTRKLNAHIRNVHSRGVFSCEMCNSSYKYPNALKNHEKVCMQEGRSSSVPKPATSSENVHKDATDMKATPTPEQDGEETIPTHLQDEEVEVLTIYRKYARFMKKTFKKSISGIIHEYNFPASANVNASEIVEHLSEVYNTQKTAFKINISFGVILRNNTTNEYRYFYAHDNESLFEVPILIHEQADLEKVIRKLTNSDILENAIKTRPDSKWVVHRISNIRFKVIRLENFSLGCENEDLPLFITRKKCITALTANKDGVKFADNLCLFRCISRKLGGAERNLEKTALLCFGRWLKFKEKFMSQKTFPGISLTEMPEIEKLFKLKICIYELKENDIVESVYRSKTNHTEEMCLNLHGSHLSYVNDRKTYLRKMKCRNCDKLFHFESKLHRHETSCQKATKIIFPGGFYKTKQNIFKELEEYGIYVSKENRFDPLFSVFDYESILKHTDLSDHSNITECTTFTRIHEPISFSVCSNIQGFEDPYCEIEPDLEKLSSKMMSYLNLIRIKKTEITKQKFSKVFDHLNEEIEKMKEIIEDSEEEDEANYSECAMEVDFEEEPCDSFKELLSKPNTFRNFLSNIQDQNRIEGGVLETQMQNNDRVRLGYYDTNEEVAHVGVSEVGSIDEEEIENDSSVASITEKNIGIDIHNTTQCKTLLKKMKDILARFTVYCEELVCLGFHSGKYDINLFKTKFPKLLNLFDNPNKFVVKKGNDYCCISNGEFKFLDIKNFLAPGFTYDKFIKAYNCEMHKSYFPYEWFSSPDKLVLQHLPDYDAFYSELKQTNVLEEEYDSFTTVMNANGGDTALALKILGIAHPPLKGGEKYAELQNIWRTLEMKNFGDFLKYYNNLDTKPFVEAVTKMLEFYKDKNVDLFKEAISVPGVARLLVFESMRENAYFGLFSEHNKDLHDVLCRNLVGGPAIVFSRHHLKDVTKIRGGSEKCQKVLSFDANCLYLYTLSLPMPCGYVVWRKPESAFKPMKDFGRLRMFQWMDYLAYKMGDEIVHAMNNKGREKRIPPYRVDGYCAKTNSVYEFDGCFFHCHECFLTDRISNDDKWNLMKEKKQKQDEKRKDYIRSFGYELITIKECEFLEQIRSDKDLKHFLQFEWDSGRKIKKRELSEEEILKFVSDGSIFGAVECDIHVPAHLHDYFSEMSPIFCNSEISFEDIGAHMQKHVETHNISKKPRRLLIGGMKAQKILLATPLLKWYLEHGLLVTKIYKVIEFEKKVDCFKSFVEEVTNGRRAGDVDSSKKLIGETLKLIGNSAFGSFIMDKKKHRNMKYAQNEKKAQLFINSRIFRDIDELEENVFEVELAKSKIVMDTPIQIGFFILQYAKLRMLEFYYEFMDEFFSRKDFEYSAMDTDSAIIAFSANNIFSLVPENKRKEFVSVWEMWFGKSYCPDHKKEFFTRLFEGSLDIKCGECDKVKKFESRTPGCFKVEAEGDEIIALCSKMYCIRNGEETKFSCKGVNKKAIKDPMEIYRKVLTSTETEKVVNRGFRVKDNKIYSYEVEKNGFGYFYPKRQVQSDGVSTIPLDIMLKVREGNEDLE